MRGGTFLEIVGAMHLVAYAIMGFSFAFTLFVNWASRQWKMKADMIRIYKRLLEERIAKRARR